MLAKIHATEVPPALRDIDATPWVRRRRDPLPAEDAQAVLAAVDLAEPPAERPVLVHGDFTPDNVLADGDAITGIIDWPGAGTGASEYDLATALLSLRGIVDEAAVAAFVRGYVEATA
jgi:aminoglycoside phosphotransferase (APT) family kinase protein